MLSIVLNLLGVVFVVYGIYFLIKINRTSQVEEFQDFEDILSAEEEFMDNRAFLDLIEKELENSSKEQMDSYEKEKEFENITFKEPIKKIRIENPNTQTAENGLVKDMRKDILREDSNPLHREVLELKKIGLTNEEISKKMNRSVREVEIILRLNGK